MTNHAVIYTGLVLSFLYAVVLQLGRRRRRRRVAKTTQPYRLHPRTAGPDLKAYVYSRDEGVCRYCGVAVHFRSICMDGGCDNCYEVDHIDAWSAGGHTVPPNLIAACRRCNRTKSDRTVDDFLNDQWRAP